MVDEGAIRATAAYEISKLHIADDQRAVAAKVLGEGLDHQATVAEVRRRRSPSAGTTRRNGRLPAEQQFRGSHGVKFTIQSTARHTPEDVLADLRELVRRLERTTASDVA